MKQNAARIVSGVGAGVLGLTASWWMCRENNLEAETATLQANSAANEVQGRILSRSPAEAGKYLVLVGGCNDCHTPGYNERGRAVPEDQWLLGSPVGFRGPWGTTYPGNLRLFVEKMTSADDFVKIIRARNTRPPMPWESLHSMSDDDLKSLYAYLKSLPIQRNTVPEYVPPGVEPKTPFILFEPQLPKR